MRSISLGTREAAFISAIFAAGVVHAITTDCRNGKIQGCECEQGRHSNNLYGVGNIVDGCSENIKYGIAFSERFIDTAEVIDQHRQPKKSSDVKTMNLHNYRVGRKVSINFCIHTILRSLILPLIIRSIRAYTIC